MQAQSRTSTRTLSGLGRFERILSCLGQWRDQCFNRVEEEILAELLLFLPSVGESRLDCREQVRGVKWFIQKINGAIVESSLSNLSVIVGRDKDNRQVWTLEPDATLQLDATHTRHSDVCNQTRRRG